jgi:hypothetical protein
MQSEEFRRAFGQDSKQTLEGPASVRLNSRPPVRRRQAVLAGIRRSGRIRGRAVEFDDEEFGGGGAPWSARTSRFRISDITNARSMFISTGILVLEASGNYWHHATKPLRAKPRNEASPRGRTPSEVWLIAGLAQLRGRS